MIKPFLTYPILAGPLWGYNMETGLGVMRLIFSGVFDKYPSLRIILGHLREALPFWLWRIENRWLKGKASSTSAGNQLRKTPGQYIKDNIFVTTSGMFGQEAFLCTYLALGAEKTLFAVDYPFESNEEAVQFMDLAPICDSDKEKIYNLNAGKLLAL